MLEECWTFPTEIEVIEFLLLASIETLSLNLLEDFEIIDPSSDDASE